MPDILSIYLLTPWLLWHRSGVWKLTEASKNTETHDHAEEKSISSLGSLAFCVRLKIGNHEDYGCSDKRKKKRQGQEHSPHQLRPVTVSKVNFFLTKIKFTFLVRF